MKIILVLCAAIAVAVAKPGYFPALGYPYGIPGIPAGVLVGAPGGFEDAGNVAAQNALAVAQGAEAAAQGARAAAEGAQLSSPGVIAYGPAAPIVLTAQGVPVDTPEVQAARAANALAHLQAKALLG